MAGGPHAASEGRQARSQALWREGHSYRGCSGGAWGLHRALVAQDVRAGSHVKSALARIIPVQSAPPTHIAACWCLKQHSQPLFD